MSFSNSFFGVPVLCSLYGILDTFFIPFYAVIMPTTIFANSELKSLNRSFRDALQDAQRSKQFLPFLQRAGRSEGVVEFVASGSRMRIYIPRDTCLVTFLLSGINCPRSARIGPNGKLIGESEPFAEEALKFTRSKVLQREVSLALYIFFCF